MAKVYKAEDREKELGTRGRKNTTENEPDAMFGHAARHGVKHINRSATTGRFVSAKARTSPREHYATSATPEFPPRVRSAFDYVLNAHSADIDYLADR